MIKSKLSIIIDTFLLSTIICFLLFVWINKYIKNAFLSLFVCNFIYILLFFIIFKYLNNKLNHSKLKLNEQKICQLYLKFLTYSTDKENRIYFEKLLNTKSITEYLFENSKSYFYINIKSTLSSIDFNIINNFYLSTNKLIPLTIICNATNDEFNNLLIHSPNKYHLVFADELFSVMKKNNIFPTQIEIRNYRFNKLKKFKEKTISALSKNYFFKFLFSGLSLVLISLFIPFSYYYLIFGSFLLILSIICLFNKNTQNNISSKVDLISLTKKD